MDLLECDAAADFDAAATIHRLCRRAGVTPRGMVDCPAVGIHLDTVAGIDLDDAPASEPES
jgi:hypothetical protein